MRGGSVTQEHFHVSSVWRGAVIDFRCKTDAAHFFGAEGIFHVVEAWALKMDAVINVHTA